MRPARGVRERARPSIGIYQTSFDSARDVDRYLCFQYSGTMDTKAAVQSLAALAQDSRLEVYRQLVQAGPEGVAAGELAEHVGIPANTLSFHLKTLSHAGLVEARQAGRFIYYSANYATMNALLGFLSENCCGGRACVPVVAPGRKRKLS